GRGGMGVVYEAEQESLGRRVALKVVANSRLADPKLLARFAREAKAAARLHHTNIVPVFGVGEAEGVHYYVMQFIQGQGLAAVLDDLRRLEAGKGLPVETAKKKPDEASVADVARSLMAGQFASPAPGLANADDPVATAGHASSSSNASSTLPSASSYAASIA